ncbi:Ankyrin repeat-containing domain protein [Russula decolorans]
MSTMRPEEPGAVPLYHAARLGFGDLAKHLIVEHPDHVNAKGGRLETPMHAAVDAEHANILSLLIEHGADMEGQSEDMYNGTPLHLAAWLGRLGVGQCLLGRGANTSARDNGRDTPLINAVLRGHIEFARMLLEHGAVIDAQNNYGETALYSAVRDGYTQAVQLLLERGADANVRDKEGDTPSKLASLYGNQEIVELMSAYGAESVKK